MLGRRRALWALGGLWVVACADAGKRTYEEALSSYELLVRQGKLAQDPGFEAVARRLETVPEGSAFHGRAQSLARTIRRSQGKAAGLPLFRAEKHVEEQGAKAKEDECIRLTERLGHTAGKERVRMETELSRCRAELERLVHDHEETP